MIEEAKKTEHGMCWFSEKGPINISKEGVMTPAFTNSLPQIKEELYEEFGCSIPVSFMTSEGVKTMFPGKSYDKNLNEIN